MSFFDDVKDFFSDTFGGESERAESGLADAGKTAAKGATARAKLGDEQTYVAQDVDVVRAKQDLQMAKQQRDQARVRRDNKKAQLKRQVAQAYQQAQNAHLKQDYSKPASNGPSPAHQRYEQLKAKLDNFPQSVWQKDFESAVESVDRMKQRLQDAEGTARARYHQQVGR